MINNFIPFIEYLIKMGDQDNDQPATKGFMRELIDNLKSDLKSDLDSKVKNAIAESETIKQLKEKTEVLERKVDYLQRKDRLKNLVVHGYPDNKDNNRVLRDKIAECLEKIIPYEEAGINFNMSIQFAKRLGRVIEKRPVLIEFSSPSVKREMFAWKNKLKEQGFNLI